MPLIYFAFLIQSDFDFGKIIFIRILFFSIALALPFVMINAFAFANFNNFDLKYYLKSKQKVIVNIETKNLNTIDEIMSNIQKSKKWIVIEGESDYLIIKKTNLLINDKISVLLKAIDENKHEITIESKPYTSLLFIDFARNYRNIIYVLKTLKKH